MTAAMAKPAMVSMSGDVRAAMRAIPLGDDYWGYIRDIKDASAAILAPISRGALLGIDSLIGQETLEVEGYCEPWDHPTWVYLGKWRFDNEDDAWPPPKYSYDILNPEIIQIYDRGRLERTKDRTRIQGMKKDEGLCFPGHLVMKIRSLHNMDSDPEEINRFAPLTSNWQPQESSNPI
ncbi:MAG: hypothetical protein AAGM22_28370 [Acidobacteriota bacterium]